jgi:hypothetical protein
MATTRIYPIHTGKGRSVAKALRDVTDYMENPLKTEGGEFISSYECAPETADNEFLLSKAQYLSLTGRNQGSRDVIAYHTRQSFKPGEITPQEANAIGYELAMRFTHGRHAFIVCTHTDKAHIHNHLVWNSTALDARRKWRDFFRSGRALRRCSDTLCIEHGLSVIDNPASGHGKHYGEWLGDGKRLSHQDELRAAIDAALAQSPATFDDFIYLMRAAGYTVNTNRKHITFLLAEWKQPTRMDTLGGDHTEAAVRDRMGRPVILSSAGRETVATSASRKPGLLIDIESKLRQGKGEGYAHWARLFNLKQMAQTLLYLQEHGFTDVGDLKEKAAAAAARFNALSGRIRELEAELKSNAELQKHIVGYSKTRKVYEEYRKAGYSKKFKAAHDADIILHQAAKTAFDALGYGKGKKIPAVKTLRTEYAAALEEKKKAYAEYRAAKTEMRELLACREYVERILNAPDRGRERDAEHPEV